MACIYTSGTGGPGSGYEAPYGPAPFRVGRYYGGLWRAGSSTSAGWLSGHGRIAPAFIHEQVTLDQIGIFGSISASRSIRFAIYRLDQSTLVPVELVLNAGSVAGVLTAVWIPVTIDQVLPPDMYGMAFAMFGTGTSATFSIQNLIDSYGPYGSATPTGATTPAATPALSVNGDNDDWTTNPPAPGDWAVPTGGATDPVNTGAGVFIRRSA